MIFKTLSAALLCFSLVNQSLSQVSKSESTEYKLGELKSSIMEQKTEKQIGLKTEVSSASGKSPALAALFSVVLPGAGHYYLGRMDVGKYFFGADVASWIGLVTLNVYGDNVRDDSRKFSVQHAQVSGTDGKNDDYFANVGNYDNIYDYNNDKLIRGEYANLYDVNTYYWNWDNADNMNIYETQRKNSERIYNTRIVFGSILVANRIVSAISAYLIANSKPDKKKSSMIIMPELIQNKDSGFDGLKINLSKYF